MRDEDFNKLFEQQEAETMRGVLWFAVMIAVITFLAVLVGGV
jgi:hypothetical protein